MPIHIDALFLITAIKRSYQNILLYVAAGISEFKLLVALLLLRSERKPRQTLQPSRVVFDGFPIFLTFSSDSPEAVFCR